MDQELTELLTIQEAAKLLNVNVYIETLCRWDKGGKFKTIRVGIRRGVGERRYHRGDINKNISKHK